MSAIQQMIMAAYGAAVWTPATLFAASEQGVWYDPSDFSTMFQDSAGTTPVTAVGQPVGLLLDKSKGLALGPELITVAADREFSSDTGFWNKDAGVTISGGAANWSAPVSTSQIYKLGYLVIGKYYEITYTVLSVSGGHFEAKIGGSSGTPRTTPGTYTQRLLAVTGANIGVMAIGVVTGSIDNISIRELPGNHATQATAAARPVLQQDGNGKYYLAFDGVDDSLSQSTVGGSTTAFMLCAAVKPEGGAASARTIWSDAGTNTGYIVRLNESNQLEMAVGNGTAYTKIATTATVDVGTAYVVTAWDDGTNLNVQVNNGAVASVARPTVSAGTATATLGKNNGAATGFFNGQLIFVVQVKNDGGTGSERTATKAYVASKTGVTL